MPFVNFNKIEKICNHPEHNCPTMIVLKEGIHTWKCPSCGKCQIIRIVHPRMKSEWR